MKTYAGSARHLERAVTVAFYRTVERMGIERTAARRGAERIDRGLQRIGGLYLLVAVPVIIVLLIASNG